METSGEYGEFEPVSVGARTTIDWKASRKRAMLHKLQVLENVVRSRLECGGPLSAQEVIDGVKLSHEDFLYLAELCRLGSRNSTAGR